MLVARIIWWIDTNSYEFSPIFTSIIFTLLAVTIIDGWPTDRKEQSGGKCDLDVFGENQWNRVKRDSQARPQRSLRMGGESRRWVGERSGQPSAVPRVYAEEQINPRDPREEVSDWSKHSQWQGAKILYDSTGKNKLFAGKRHESYGLLNETH